MIPFIHAETFSLFGITFRAWGTLIAAAFLVGTWIASIRAKQKGLSSERIVDLATAIFFAAMIGARLFHVVFYEPGYYLAHPWQTLDPRTPGFSMYDGFFGAALAFFWSVKRWSLDWIAYADTLVWGLPWGCGIGRIGCFLIHDHPGTLTHFVLGVKYPDGQTRHDLGLYLSLLGFATGFFFLWLNRRPRPAGFWFGIYLVIEGMSRLLLDGLRVADTRYFGWTPTQYLAIPLICVGGYFLKKSFSLPKKNKLV